MYRIFSAFFMEWGKEMLISFQAAFAGPCRCGCVSRNKDSVKQGAARDLGFYETDA